MKIEKINDEFKFDSNLLKKTEYPLKKSIFLVKCSSLKID